MSRTIQDSFIDDDEEESCPLCVEEFDLSDKNFRPCPCGYQICQFCYHNVRNNMNGLCPACRRPYQDSTIEFHKPSLEEEAVWKAKQASRQKRTAVAQQRDVQKREAETNNRKHLAGLRVVQKNLVYVTGLSPSVQEDRLLETLRGQQYFGQYGKIIKIVVSKAKDSQASVGVYVTYARKEDAASCIDAVDGSQNGDRTLRAQFGTTKYCSAYLRHEQCQNKNCMFLHEPGEDKDSFTRQDLSSMNVASTQQAGASPSYPPPQSQQPVAAARPDSSGPSSDTGAALPSSASWASKQPPSRSVSRAAGPSTASPAIPPSILSQQQPARPPTPAQVPLRSTVTETRSTIEEPTVNVEAVPEKSAFVSFVNRILSRPAARFRFDDSSFTEEQKDIINNFPCMIDPMGGQKRRMMKNKMEEEQRRLLGDQISRATSTSEVQRSGSLQLGGEPESDSNIDGAQRRAPGLGLGSGLALDHDNLQMNGRGMIPTHQQSLLQRFKPSSSAGISNFSNNSQPLGMFQLPPQQQQQQSQHLPQLPPPQQQLLQQQQQLPQLQSQLQQSEIPGHARNASRFSFANDVSATANVKPVASSKIMDQQASMMPAHTSMTSAPPAPFYTSTVTGPPPGLKASAVNPISGVGMFGQGQGFASGSFGYNNNAVTRNPNDELMRELARRRGLDGQDANKPNFSVPFNTVQTGNLGIDQSSATNQIVGLGANESPTDSKIVGNVTPTISSVTNHEESKVKSLSSHIVTPIVPSHLPNNNARTKENPPTPGQALLPPTISFDPLKIVESVMDTKNQPEASIIADQLKDDEQFPVLGAAPIRSVNLNHPMRKTSRKPQQPIQESIPTTPVKTTPKRIQSPVGESKVPDQMPTLTEKSENKRNHPGKLDIPSNVKQQMPQLPVETPVKTGIIMAPLTPSQPTTPGSPLEMGTNKKKAHTIRLVSTPKAENMPAIPSLTSIVTKLPVRSSSIVSSILPETPGNDHISDTVSLTSTSISRPPSPQLDGKNSSTRFKSKNQIKRERQEKAKALEDVQVSKVQSESATPVEEEIVHEAITGRKKKTKKPTLLPTIKTASTNMKEPISASTTVAPSPVIEAKQSAPASPQVETPQSAIPSPKVVETPVKAKAEKTEDLVSTIIKDVQASSSFLAQCVETFFKPLAQANNSFKPTQSLLPTDVHPERPFRRNPDVGLTPEQLRHMITYDEALKYGGEDNRVWSHGCITTGGAHLRHLESQLEERYIELERNVQQLPTSLRFHAIYDNYSVNELISTYLPKVDIEDMKRDLLSGGTGSLKSREANAMEKAIEEHSKKGSFLVGNAEQYINDFVMPVVSFPSSSSSSSSGSSSSADGEGKAKAGHHVGNNTRSQHNQENRQGSSNNTTKDNISNVNNGGGGGGGGNAKSILAELEKQLREARKDEEQREISLRKLIKQNRKVMGYVH